LKRKKENEFSFYALHQNQLLSEELFSTAWFVSKKLCEALRFFAALRLNPAHPVIRSENLSDLLFSYCPLCLKYSGCLKALRNLWRKRF
jgi:hypothetical protein